MQWKEKLFLFNTQAYISTFMPVRCFLNVTHYWDTNTHTRIHEHARKHVRARTPKHSRTDNTINHANKYIYKYTHARIYAISRRHTCAHAYTVSDRLSALGAYLINERQGPTFIRTGQFIGRVRLFKICAIMKNI